MSRVAFEIYVACYLINVLSHVVHKFHVLSGNFTSLLLENLCYVPYGNFTCRLPGNQHGKFMSRELTGKFTSRVLTGKFTS